MRAKLIFGGLLCVSLAGVVGAGCGSSAGGGDGGGDSGAKETAPPADAAKEAMCVGGFDAAVAMFNTTAACTSCIETKDSNCTSYAKACACDPDCIKVVQCQIACVDDGGVGEDCAMTCISKAGAVPGGEAESFDYACLFPGKPCAAICVKTAMDASHD